MKYTYMDNFFGKIGPLSNFEKCEQILRLHYILIWNIPGPVELHEIPETESHRPQTASISYRALQ